MEVGDVIQITNPDDKWFATLLIISELKSFGVQAYAIIPMQGDAYYRVKTGDFEVIGKARVLSE